MFLCGAVLTGILIVFSASNCLPDNVTRQKNTRRTYLSQIIAADELPPICRFDLIQVVCYRPVASSATKTNQSDNKVTKMTLCASNNTDAITMFMY